jgi:hypothetical protein
VTAKYPCRANYSASTAALTKAAHWPYTSRLLTPPLPASRAPKLDDRHRRPCERAGQRCQPTDEAEQRAPAAAQANVELVAIIAQDDRSTPDSW